MTARLPIRWRLTLWQLLLLAAALLLFGAALYLGLRAVLHENFEEQVRNEAAFALAGVTAEGGMMEIAPDALAQLEDDDHFVRLVSSNGDVVLDTSAGLGGVPLDPGQVDQALGGEMAFSTFHSGPEPIGIATVPVIAGDEIAGALQVGTSRGDTDEVLRLTLIVMAVAGPVVLLIAGAGGYLLAGRALAPVEAITTLAADVSGSDLHARLGLDLPDDELGRLARTFDAMLERIESSFERQRRFTSDAAHELRTPLATMRSQIDIVLARPRAAGEYRAALEELDADVERMTRLVGTLLSLARSDAGQLAVERTSTDLAEVVTAVLGQYDQTTRAAGVDLFDQSSPTICFVDRDLVIQLLINLLDNAIAHTPLGGSVAVGCDVRGSQAMVWVEDTGTGISPEHQPYVFDPFYRADHGRSREHGGTGLGLSIAKAIVDAHGGTITLESKQGAGTRVEATFPA